MTNLLTQFIAALIMAESGGNIYEYNPAEQAHGPLQIRECVLADIRRWTGYGWITPRYCYSRWGSEWMCRRYLAHYCTRARLGHEPGPKDWLRRWRGRRMTEADWEKFRREYWR